MTPKNPAAQYTELHLPDWMGAIMVSAVPATISMDAHLHTGLIGPTISLRAHFDPDHIERGMLQFATIEEAWANAMPPRTYQSGNLFDVARDGTTSDPNFCGLDTDTAIESAYPGSEHQHRSTSSRSMNTPPLNAPNESGCNAAAGGGRPQQMYSRLNTYPRGDADQPRRTASEKVGDSDASAREVQDVRNSYADSAPRESVERGRLYDVLIFFLFGLLILLAMHEIAALGEKIGCIRARACHVYSHSARAYPRSLPRFSR